MMCCAGCYAELLKVFERDSCCVLCTQKLRSWIKSPDNDYIIGAGSKPDSSIIANGIVPCHAYAVLDIVVLPVRGTLLIKP